MTEILLASATAFWLGILTSISPCPLATNIAAISYIGRRLGNPRQVLWGGLLYTAGRALTYGVLGFLLVESLLKAPVLSMILQRYLNKALGPLLILVGMFLVGLIALPAVGGGLAARFKDRVGDKGLVGALLLGILFALSFCPISAALFFGTLIPVAVAHKSGILLPSIYGIGTGLPVMVMSIVVMLGARSLATMFHRMTAFEQWARRITGVVFIGVGIYMTLVYVFRVLS